MDTRGGAAAEDYARRVGRWSTVGAAVWLVFLWPTLVDTVERGSWHAALGIVLLVVFALAYLGVFAWSRGRRASGSLWLRVDGQALAAVGGLQVLAVLITLVAGPSGLSCFVYVAVAAMLVLPGRWAWPHAVVVAVATEAVARLVPGWQRADTIGLSVLLAAFAVWGIAQAIRRSLQLAESREENAHLLLEQERARVARDLHDVLGHSLTVVTVKAELAGRLLDAGTPEAVARARREVDDVERLSRDALADVRLTVEGVREPGLAAELARARTALEAAEIEADLPGSTDEVPTALRGLFAWAVREGVTNVVRHSGARRCVVTLAPDRVRVADDGHGTATSTGGGHGLAGLRERAALGGATVVVESAPGRGFSLLVVAT